MAAYTTGKMNNPNAKVEALKTPGSKGVKVGLNSKACVQMSPKGRSGGTSVAPKKAVPGKK